MLIEQSDRQLFKDLLREIREYNRRNKKTELWVSAKDVLKLTGWSHERLREARVKAQVQFKVVHEATDKRHNVYAYNLESINPKLYTNLKVAS